MDFKYKENRFLPGTLEYKIFKTNHCILGCQFMYKEIYMDEEYYTCDLCYKDEFSYSRMQFEKAFEHLISDEHNVKYLNLKYKMKLVPNSSIATSAIEDYFKKEGKIQVPIYTLRENTEREKYLPQTSQSCHSETEKKPQSIDMFIEELCTLQEKMIENKSDDFDIIKDMLHDEDSLEVLIILVKVFAEKFDCCLITDKELNIKDCTSKFLKKCKEIKLLGL